MPDLPSRPRDIRVVVLDDDPTGTQSAAGVTVLFEHDPAQLGEVLARERSVYLQTNSRSLSEADAVTLATGIRSSIATVGEQLGVDVKVVLRGDSTLRGHVFAESRVFLAADAVMVFVPAFPAGGRYTLNGRHLVRGESGLTPVGETEFARDPVFGFRSSDLVDFVRERTGGQAIAVWRDDLRSGALSDALRRAPAQSVLVVDAVEDDDIRAIGAAVTEVWAERDVIVRCAAPLAADLAGVASGPYLDSRVLERDGGVLVVCGSHTALARAQVTALAGLIGPPTEIDTARALVDPEAEGRRAAEIEASRQRPGRARFLTSERDRSADHATLQDGAAVMNALTTAAGVLAPGIGTVITKGGITAADVIRRSLGARRSRVIGQVEAGVSVWDVIARDRRTVRCMIVPGNMGRETVLADAVRRLLGDG